MKTHGPLNHPSHPQHQLKWRHTTNTFICDGCKEPGIGNKYKCDKCHFDLHEECASFPDSALKHRFLKTCEFKLHFELRPNMNCDACNKVVQGFGYRCKNCKYVLHPRCAHLPPVLHAGNVELHLRWKSLSQPCNECKTKGPGWSYRSDCQKHHLHVACAKDLLKEAWDATHQNKAEKKVREMQAMIPKMVVTPKNRQHVKGKGGGGGGEKIRKYVSFFAVAVRVVVSALLGDPTAIIVAAANCILPSQRMKRLGN